MFTASWPSQSLTLFDGPAKFASLFNTVQLTRKCFLLMAKEKCVPAVEIDFKDIQMLRLNPTLAKEIGLNESVVFLQIQFWIKGSNNVRDGQRWTYQTLEKMQADAFPFLSRGAIDRAIRSLETLGLIIIANYNVRKSDRTRWFAINVENARKLSAIIISQNEKSFPNNGNAFIQNGKSISQNGTTLPKDFPEISQKKYIEPQTAVVEPGLVVFEEYLTIARVSQPRNVELRNYAPSIFDAGQIQETVRHLELWQECLKFWLSNRYQMQHLGKILNLYKEKEPQWVKEHPSSAITAPPDVPVWDDTIRAMPPPKRERVN